MPKIKVSEASSAALDWMLAQLEGESVHYARGAVRFVPGQFSDEEPYSPSTDWAQGGPIIDREKISTCWEGTTWVATLFNKDRGEAWYGHNYGPAPLIAAMRCYVVSKLGEEVEVPKEILK